MLTEHQKEKLNQSLSILSTQDRLLIKGSAGVGKTFMVNELLKALQPSISGLMYCSAPTNKAVSVLKGKISLQEKRLIFITTHAALKLQREIDNKTGEIHFKPNLNSKYMPLMGVKLFIIDEASMISKELLGYIEEHAKRQGAKVVFLGDNKQLNPVNEEDSPVFLAEYPEVELTEIVRQKGGNPIIDLSNNLTQISNKTGNRSDVGGYVYTYDTDKILQTLAQVNGSDELKYIAYTNAEVDKMNKLVRQRIYGENPNKIEIGETMIFDAPYKDYYTNEELLVEECIVKEKEFLVPHSMLEDKIEDKFLKINFKYYSINPTLSVGYDENGNVRETLADNIIVIHEDSEKDFKDCLKVLKDRIKISECKWTDYYQFYEQFAQLKYNHAITVHKS